MRRIFRPAVVFAIAAIGVSIVPAAAQFGGIFGDPPRPPSNVPSRPPASQDDRFMQQQPRQPQPSPAPAGPPSGIESQPLPPPPGVPAQPAAAPAAPLPGPNVAPGQRQPLSTMPGPADTAPQPGDEVVTAPPAQKIVNPTASFSGLDKITGRITSFDVAINETVQFGALQVTPRVCYTRPPTDTPNTDAFVEVDEVTLQGEVKRIFTGWMFAASPGLHGVEHPIYDVWLADCKGGSPVAQVPATAAAPARPTPTRPAPTKRPPPPRPGPPR
jgi:hypothetical protein